MDQYFEQNENIILYIYRQLPYLNPALRRIAQYLIDHPDDCQSITINDLADKCQVAESTISRFVKEMGLPSFQQLKILLAEHLSSSHEAMEQPESGSNVYEDIGPEDSVQDIVDKVVFHNIEAIKLTKSRIHLEQIQRAAEAIERAKTLIFVCIGSSNVSAEEGVLRFSRAGKKCLYYKESNLQMIVSSTASPDDVVIAISNSGRSVSVVDALSLAKKQGAKTIAITSFEDSPLAKTADIALFTATKSAPVETGITFEAYSSKSAQIVVLDMIYAYYASRNHEETASYLDQTYKAVKHTRLKP